MKQTWVLLLDLAVGIAASAGLAILGGTSVYPMEWSLLVGLLISTTYFGWLSPSFRSSKRGKR